MFDRLYPFRGLEWRRYFHQYTTPRDWKKGARDIPFGLGAKTLYVDGNNGNDHNDGLSWKTAFKTIQHAIDEADSWSLIFVKAATYEESLVLDSQHLKIIGESRSSVIISPSSASHVVEISADQCELYNLKIILPSGATSAVKLASFKNLLDNLWLHNESDSGWGCLMDSGYDEQIVRFSKITGFMNQLNIAGGIKHLIHDNDFILNGNGGVNIYIDSTSRCLIHDNFCDGGGAGTGIDSVNNSLNLYFHNNLLNHDENASEDSANNYWRENFYDDGPADDDHDGYGDSPYDVGNPAGTDYDYFPVAKLNGWKPLHGCKGSKIGLGYDGADDAVETTSSVRGHLLLEGNRVGAGYDALDDLPRNDGSVRGHLLFLHNHIAWHKIEDVSDYNDTTVNPIKANKEYPILKIYRSGSTIYVYKYVWTTDQNGADPDLTTAQSLITSFDGDLFEVSKILITVDPSMINGLWDNMGASDKLYLFMRYYDGVSSDMKLIPPVVLRDKASDSLASSPPVDSDKGESVVFDTEKLIQPTILVVYFYVDHDISTRTFVPFSFSVKRAH